MCLIVSKTFCSDFNPSFFYDYLPNQYAAYTFVAVFALDTKAHFICAIVYRSPFFIPFIIGGICEAFGYYGRACSHQAATVYMSLGRITRAFQAEQYSMIRTNWLTKIFVLTDIFCFCTQIGGGGIQASTSANVVHIGKLVVLNGFIFQLVLFALFDSEIKWQYFFCAIYVISFAIFIRNLFRAIEYAESEHGYIHRHEAVTYMTDALPMFIIMTIF
ncbi:uncharacterized protein V1516DRAFT_697410 [Lipomyces oligophaga]|uniref:uncharacterized protein n=1 Tax=Lipomyces oligophaga TaxID=45792 RepID=UPI0034CD4BD9